MRRLFSFCLIFTAFTASSQRVLTVEEAIATALQNNFDIKLAKNDSMVAALDYSYRNAAFLPQLNASAGYVFNNVSQRQKFSDGTVRERSGINSNNLTANINLNWTIFDGFRMFATRDKLAEFIRLGEYAIRNQVMTTVAGVITTYYNIVREKQQLLAVEEQISISSERVKLAQYKLDIGVGAKPDVLQSKVDLNEQRGIQLTEQALIIRLKDELNQLMNVASNTEYEVSDSIPINRALVLTDFQVNLEKTNPALLIAQKNIDIARLTLRERRADRLPSVALTGNYNFNRLSNQAVVNPFSPLFSRNHGFNYGVTASIPIFNNYNTKRLIQQAKLDISYNELYLENQKTLVNLSLLTAYRNYLLQLKALALEEESILLARENVDIVLQVYRLNSTTLIQLKEAQKSLQDARTRLITARYNTKLAETELLRLKGELLK
jgi:outer membrane protein